METPGIDERRVTDWLTDRLCDLTPPFEFSLIGRGRSNLTYRVDDAAGRRVVLRRPPLGSLLASAHNMAREHLILSRLGDAGAPVPRTLAWCSDPSVTGAEFFVMAHVDGMVLDRVDAASALSRVTRQTAGRSLAATLAAMHALDVDAIGLGDLSRRHSYAKRQLRRWTTQWDRSATTDDPRIHRVASRLAARIPPQQETRLVHGDYRLDNVVVDAGGSVVAVLDWELCTLGDPLADLGLLLAYTPGDMSEVLPLQEEVMLLPGIPTGAELVATYAEASGRPLDGLPFWVAFGFWKIAIILQGIHRRWLDEPALRDPSIGPLEPTIRMLSARAEDLVWANGW